MYEKNIKSSIVTILINKRTFVLTFLKIYPVTKLKLSMKQFIRPRIEIEIKTVIQYSCTFERCALRNLPLRLSTTIETF